MHDKYSAKHTRFIWLSRVLLQFARAVWRLLKNAARITRSKINMQREFRFVDIRDHFPLWIIDGYVLCASVAAATRVLCQFPSHHLFIYIYIWIWQILYFFAHMQIPHSHEKWFLLKYYINISHQRIKDAEWVWWGDLALRVLFFLPIK